VTLGDTMTPIQKLQDRLVRYYGFTLRDLLGPNRSHTRSRARHVGMWIARERFGLSLVEIGQAFDRNHSTVFSALKTMRAKLDTDPELRSEVATLTPPETQPIHWVPPWEDNPELLPLPHPPGGFLGEA